MCVFRHSCSDWLFLCWHCVIFTETVAASLLDWLFLCWRSVLSTETVAALLGLWWAFRLTISLLTLYSFYRDSRSIAGIVVGCVVAIVAIAVLVVFCKKKENSNTRVVEIRSNGTTQVHTITNMHPPPGPPGQTQLMGARVAPHFTHRHLFCNKGLRSKCLCP